MYGTIIGACLRMQSNMTSCILQKDLFLFYALERTIFKRSARLRTTFGLWHHPLKNKIQMSLWRTQRPGVPRWVIFCRRSRNSRCQRGLILTQKKRLFDKHLTKFHKNSDNVLSRGHCIPWMEPKKEEEEDKPLFLKYIFVKSLFGCWLFHFDVLFLHYGMHQPLNDDAMFKVGMKCSACFSFIWRLLN